jgi:hypothetical protein
VLLIFSPPSFQRLLGFALLQTFFCLSLDRYGLATLAKVAKTKQRAKKEKAESLAKRKT